jgi:hypothetical protein
VADAKISALAAAAAALGTHEFAVNEAGASKKVTSAQVKTLVNTAPAFAAGSATAGSWPTLASGTLLTTPEDGALEFDADCFYATTDAGNRGVVAVRHIIRADATRTFTSVTPARRPFSPRRRTGGSRLRPGLTSSKGADPHRRCRRRAATSSSTCSALARRRSQPWWLDCHWYGCGLRVRCGGWRRLA